MKVLITGATGLLGGHLIKELQQRNEQIRALVLPVENADSLSEQGIEIVRGDITDASSLPPAVKDVDLIFHLAGMMGVWRPLADYRLVNVTGSENLYKAAQEAGVRRFVHTSSHTVYGLGHGRYLTENADCVVQFVAPFKGPSADALPPEVVWRTSVNGNGQAGASFDAERWIGTTRVDRRSWQQQAAAQPQEPAC